MVLPPEKSPLAWAAVACGVAGDRSAIPALATLMQKKSSDTHVRAAGCIGLGLLRDTETTPKMVRSTMLQSRWEPDGRGYAAIGLALMGDTTRLKELIRELLVRYREEMGSIQCDALKESYRTEEKKCREVIEKAAMVLDELVKTGSQREASD